MEDSDVDVLIVLKEHERSGELVDLNRGHVRVEALFSSRTVYGNRQDVEHLRLEAMTILEDGLTRLNNVADEVKKIKKCVTEVQILENFIQPSQQSIREECILALRKITELLDIQPLHHPMRTMLASVVFDYVGQIRTLLTQNEVDAATGDLPIWKMVWNRLQPTSMTMCYIKHILASKKLADRFEEEGEVDDSMYKDIVR
ncbi:hypothetical protein CPB84DRAFT_1811705 [Gymnopilus junonius]|uniref:Uncharacterized protein n=1 Tax=Gymnopilus junonius TaxID=109634 RepID=A0A9P5TV93_GYMJU|nr:hypothetical protein CPB84DRAFT_1811705 [Gymnopilus junonius]